MQTFLGLAQVIPEVELIVEATTEDGASVWTMIAAPPREHSYRYRVYEAERQALQQDGPPVEFHVVNRLELQRDWQTVMPVQCRVLFRRDPEPR